MNYTNSNSITNSSSNSNNHDGYPSAYLGLPGSIPGNRSRFNTKRLSVALPPKVEPISEHQDDSPAPRTSRSHLLQGLRTQPRAAASPVSAPYHQTQHQVQGLGASKWADHSYSPYEQSFAQRTPQTASAASFNLYDQYAMSARQQIYSLPQQQVLAPPTMHDSAEDVDPAVLHQMHMTRLFLAQRQQQLQLQLANLTAAAQGLHLQGNVQSNGFQQAPLTPQTPQSFLHPQLPSPVEVPGQPGAYLVYNPVTQGYNYVVDQESQQPTMSTVYQTQAFSPSAHEPPTPSVKVSPPVERMAASGGRTFTPPKKAPSPPSQLEHVEPLPPPSANAFRRGHKKASSLAIDPARAASDGPKTASAAVFGSQRSVVPTAPMSGTFGPGAARAGEHPIRQPRGPPPLEELVAAPTSKHEGSRNFATRQRRRALDSLMRAGHGRLGASRSNGSSPVSEGECHFSLGEESEELASVSSAGSRQMSPIGSKRKEKRGSQGSADGYFGLSSASSSEAEDIGAIKQPLTPADAAPVGDRKKMMLGVLTAAEKRKSIAM